jgi:hypothetical protein
MSTRLIFPVLAHMLWTLLVILALGRARVRALRTRKTTLQDIALSADAWPDDVKKLGNNASNQFETPVLFYGLAVIATLIGATGWIMVALAWAFVATRIGHTLVHAGANDVRLRFQIYVVGLAAILGMWFGVLAKLIT